MNSGKNIPGYSGFIPYKNDFFGNTTCSANRAAQEVYRHAASVIKTQKIGQIIVDV